MARQNHFIDLELTARVVLPEPGNFRTATRTCTYGWLINDALLANGIRSIFSKDSIQADPPLPVLICREQAKLYSRYQLILLTLDYSLI